MSTVALPPKQHPFLAQSDLNILISTMAGCHTVSQRVLHLSGLSSCYLAFDTAQTGQLACLNKMNLKSLVRQT